MNDDLLAASKADFESIIRRISVADSPVGIDAQYTHALIITYLQRIEARLTQLEARLGSG
ncbi:MAG TPA: hypothetical protein VEQ85_15445 [Lacipirellulaceae bacterium]|nr:hypothetical protein [Lacipirellulaceae bacterium]